MIYGIGIDMVAIARMQDNLDRYGERFTRKILSSDELLEYEHTSGQAHYLAKHFAAKEAVVKALGTGFSNGISLKNISIKHEDSGRPKICCDGRLMEIMAATGISSYHLSLSDEKDYACACVILEANT